MAERLVRVLALPAEPLTAWISRTAPRVAAIHIEPAMWLVAGVCDTQPEDGMAVDISDAYAAFAIEGEGAADLLSQGIALDLGQLDPDFSGRTRLGDVAVILSRTSKGYVLRCERSYAEWLGRWLERAADVTTSVGDT